MSKVIWVDFYPNGFGQRLPLHASYSREKALELSSDVEGFISLFEHEYLKNLFDQVDQERREKDHIIFNLELELTQLREVVKILRESNNRIASKTHEVGMYKEPTYEACIAIEAKKKVDEILNKTNQKDAR